MNSFPKDDALPVELLASCFGDTTNSYKFYWFMAILEETQMGRSRIAYSDLALRMISLAWHPLDYYKLSFGKRDHFVVMAKLISAELSLDKRAGAPSIYHQISTHGDAGLKSTLLKELLELLRWVPYRFIRPFFSNELKGLGDGYVNTRVKRLANDKLGHAPYHFEQNHIIVDRNWAEYFRRHHYILLGFSHWHLLKFLQRNNPNVIGLSEKLTPPNFRKLNNARALWSEFMEIAPVDCIYSGAALNGTRVSLDHFIPWSYVVHDQLWNLAPTTPKLNSCKGDALPDLPKYFESYCRLQFRFFCHLKEQKSTFAEDYHQLLKTDVLDEVSEEQFRELLFLEVSTNHRTALGMGFSKTFTLL